MNILIIESDISICHKMKKFILSCGNNNVLCVNRGIEAIRLMENKYDVIFLDLLISDVNGMNLLKHIKLHNDARVIIITSFPTVKTAVNCMKLGAADFWSIPFNIERIKKELQCH